MLQGSHGKALFGLTLSRFGGRGLLCDGGLIVGPEGSVVISPCFSLFPFANFVQGSRGEVAGCEGFVDGEEDGAGLHDDNTRCEPVITG